MDIALKVKESVEEIKSLYANDPRPWTIGFSGGKDSSAVLKLVYMALRGTPRSRRNKEVTVLYCDTGVEIPIVQGLAISTLRAIDGEAKELGLPLRSKVVFPPVRDRYFVKVIGRGYPTPTNKFRWCTNRLRVNPVARHLKIASAGMQSLVLLGIRRGESTARNRSLARHQNTEDDKFFTQSGNSSVTIYSPIRNFDAQAVWFTLLLKAPPSAIDARKLTKIYRDANGECPLVRDKSSPACGTNRFGCWTCTVVRRDRAMEALVDNGREELGALLDFRDWIASIRDLESYREQTRRNGSKGPGPFTLEARVEIFTRLMITEVSSGRELIENDQKCEIERLWRMDGYDGPTIDAIEAVTKSSVNPEVRPNHCSTGIHQIESSRIKD